MSRPANYFLVQNCWYRQDKKYELKTIKVSLVGNYGTFFLQDGTRSEKIFDRLRIREDSFKEIINKYNQLKAEQ